MTSADESLKLTADSLADFEKPKSFHPWWRMAKAVKLLIESGKYPDAVKFMEKVFND